MPDTFKNYATTVGVTASTSIYAGITGTAIVNAIHVSNTNTTLANSVSVQLFKGLTGYYIVRAAALPIQTTYQALDAPIPLNTGDTLKVTAGLTAGIDVIVSVLEST
tara:strand:- start:1069 stop:1389 length:321 start_codon:yes stop_codon:yes gene_type:complete